MIIADDLIGLIRAYNPSTNAELITKAYNFCLAMHEGQMRRSGEPYYTHPVAVACLLADQHLDDASIITALLHDTIETPKLILRMWSGCSAVKLLNLWMV